MFEITVSVFAGLRSELGFSTITISLQCGSTISSVLDLLEIHSARPLIIVVNGQIVSKHMRLKSGDSLSVFPLIGGG